MCPAHIWLTNEQRTWCQVCGAIYIDKTEDEPQERKPPPECHPLVQLDRELQRLGNCS